MNIKLLSKQDANDFINICCMFKFDIDLCYGHYIVDAKSLLGILSIGLNKKVNIVLHTENNTKIHKFETLIEKWRVYD